MQQSLLCLRSVEFAGGPALAARRLVPGIASICSIANLSQELRIENARMDGAGHCHEKARSQSPGELPGLRCTQGHYLQGSGMASNAHSKWRRLEQPEPTANCEKNPV